MRFWDSSAIVPLLHEETATETAMNLLREDATVAVWWGTPTECVSALARRERDGLVSPEVVSEALDRLDALSASWFEVPAGEAVRATARRLLMVHPLRSGDALQLAAAMIVAEGAPPSLELATLDERLKAAARKEGFRLPL